MKPTNILKILLCLLLCLVMLFSVVACGKNTEDPEDTEETEEGFIDYYEGSFEEELYRPADKKYNRTLTIMARDIAHYDVGEDYILTSGTLMNDAVYERAALMQEKFGVEILVNKGNDDVYQTPALGGQYVCDFLLVNGQRTFRLAVQDILVDLNTVSGFNLDAPYWDQQIQKDYAVGSRLYSLEGAYTYYDEYMATIMLVNTGLYNDLGYDKEYGSIHALVDDGKWTMAMLDEMAKNLHGDTNNSGGKDCGDTFGLLTQWNTSAAYFLGSGLRPIYSDDSGLVLRLDDSSYYTRCYEVLEDIMGWTNNKEYVYLRTGNEPEEGTISSMFESKRALFAAILIDAITKDQELIGKGYGIVPVPAYEEGGTYYGHIPAANHTPLSMARGAKDRDECAEIMEIINYYSRYGSSFTLYSAYFEAFRLQKLCATEDDLRMLEIVEASKAYDLGLACEVGNIAVLAQENTPEDAATLASRLKNVYDTSREKIKSFNNTMAGLS